MHWQVLNRSLPRRKRWQRDLSLPLNRWYLLMMTEWIKQTPTSRLWWKSVCKAAKTKCTWDNGCVWGHILGQSAIDASDNCTFDDFATDCIWRTIVSQRRDKPVPLPRHLQTRLRNVTFNSRATGDPMGGSLLYQPIPRFIAHRWRAS